MGDNKILSRPFFFMVGVILILVLVGAGFKITSVSISLGMIQVNLEKKTPSPFENSNPTLAPVLVSSTADAVRYYFAQISAGNYEATWSLLTDHFRSVKNPTGFGPYKDYWSTVDEVAITNISTLDEDSNSATVLVDLEFHYSDNRVIPVPGMVIEMIYDGQRQTWLINSTDSNEQFQR